VGLGIGRLANIGGPLIIAGIFGRYGYTPDFAYIAGTWVIVAITVALLGPRTGDVSLEHLGAAATGSPDSHAVTMS